jgi:DNA-binding NarL/FixJ family response regulator
MAKIRVLLADDHALLRAGLRLLVNTQPDMEVVGAATKIAPPSQGRLETLSNREREVLRLVALGHTNQAVAQQLSLSVKTIESYRSRLMAKLGLQNRAQLTQFAIEIGLLQSGTQKHEASDKL